MQYYYQENVFTYKKKLNFAVKNYKQRRAQIKIKLRRETQYNMTYFTIISTMSLTNSVAQEPEGSSPHSQQPATGPCPEPVESNPHPPCQSP
jgi:hypothetical protein